MWSTLTFVDARALATRSLLVLGAATLAFEPARWLVGTWYAPGYDGSGAIAFVLTLVLFAASWHSPLTSRRPAGHTRTAALLLGTAALRACAVVLDINVVGALLLAVDVYALGHLAQLGHRRFAVSPLYLAGLFCFCLPLEPIAQRLVGYPLQHLSATLSCQLLSPWFADLLCEGVRIRLNGVDVLVDLPCSGARVLTIAGLIWFALASIHRPAPWQAVTGLAWCGALALLGNALRISFLAIGIAFGQPVGIDVMAPVPHTVIGLVVVGFVTLGLVRWAARVTPSSPHPGRATFKLPPQLRLYAATAFASTALAVGWLPTRPADASAPLPPPAAPLYAAGLTAAGAPLSPQEAAYFNRFGGSAARASYGPYGLLVVSTQSPLRHLHDPAICLRGMGYQVVLLGTDHATSSTIYQAERGTQAYRVHVTYQAANQQLASSIGEVVWRWLADPSQRWTMIQRIEPMDPSLDPATTQRWHVAIRRAFNITHGSAAWPCPECWSF